MKRSAQERSQASQKSLQSLNNQNRGHIFSSLVSEYEKQQKEANNKPSSHIFSSLVSEYEKQQKESANKPSNHIFSSLVSEYEKQQETLKKERLANEKLKRAVNDLNLDKANWDEKHKIERDIDKAKIQKTETLSNDISKALNSSISSLQNSVDNKTFTNISATIMNKLASEGIIADNNGKFTTVDVEKIADITDDLANNIETYKDEIRNHPKVLKAIDGLQNQLKAVKACVDLVANSRAYRMYKNITNPQGIDTFELVDDVKDIVQEMSNVETKETEDAGFFQKAIIKGIQGIMSVYATIKERNQPVGVADKRITDHILKHNGMTSREEYEDFRRRAEEGRQYLINKQYLVPLR